ncbi:MAG TPA: molybdopterin-synthase adenylyltransferase MoeB [Armatimonadota bacterium]|jgi:molybdopterin/thiamine biosynthesis adenylyltransferase/rhodanese-related sulfurtransferase
MARSRNDLLEEARAQVPEVSAGEARERLGDGATLVIDVRDDDEWREGHLEGAHHLTRGMLEFGIGDLCADVERPVLLYCAAGSRSLLAGLSLRTLGYSRVESLTGGIRAWKEAGYPVVAEKALSAGQRQRYSRHFPLPGVGPEGQAKLLDSRVLIVGAGGLGCPSALYLAAAGVGHLGIVDGDRVDLTNLQRQVLFADADVGRPKVEVAQERLKALNPEVEVTIHDSHLSLENAWDIVRDYDVLLQCTDSFSARYLLNDVAHFARKPVVDASIHQFQGQATILDTASGGPCYRCLFPEMPQPGAACGCNEAGVFGVLPGVLGTLQATETLKLLLGLGTTLVGRLLLVDLLAVRVRDLAVGRDPKCPLCGDAPTIANPWAGRVSLAAA